MHGRLPPDERNTAMAINYIIKCWPWFMLALIIGAGLGW